MRPVITTLLKEGIRHTDQKSRFRRQLVDKRRMVPVLHGEVWSEVSCHGYGADEVAEPPDRLACLGWRRTEDEDGLAED